MQYTKPKVTEIELDTSQAILAACMVAPGAWFSTFYSRCYGFTAVGTRTFVLCTAAAGRSAGQAGLKPEQIRTYLLED